MQLWRSRSQLSAICEERTRRAGHVIQFDSKVLKNQGTGDVSPDLSLKA